MSKEQLNFYFKIWYFLMIPGILWLEQVFILRIKTEQIFKCCNVFQQTLYQLSRFWVGQHSYLYHHNSEARQRIHWWDSESRTTRWLNPWWLRRVTDSAALLGSMLILRECQQPCSNINRDQTKILRMLNFIWYFTSDIFYNINIDRVIHLC